MVFVGREVVRRGVELIRSHAVIFCVLVVWAFAPLVALFVYIGEHGGVWTPDRPAGQAIRLCDCMRQAKAGRACEAPNRSTESASPLLPVAGRANKCRQAA